MKVFLLFSFLFCTIVFCHSQQNKPTHTEKELKKLSNDWMIAAINKDEKTLNRLVAPEFKLSETSIDSSTSPLNRDIWMKNTLENLKIDSFNYINMRVEVIDNIAIVQSTFYWSFSFRGQPAIKDNGQLIDTWMKRKDGWQVVRRIVVDK